MVNIPKKQQKPPSHAWDWYEFQYLCETNFDSFADVPPTKLAVTGEVQQVDGNILDMDVTALNVLVNTMNHAKSSPDLDIIFEDYEECWDNSPEQYELTVNFCNEAEPNLSDDEYEDPLFHSTKLFSPEQSEPSDFPIRQRHKALPSGSELSDLQNLTSEDSDDEVFFFQNRPVTRSILKRKNAFRRKKNPERASSLNINRAEKNIHIPKLDPISLPNSPGQVRNDLKQNLSLVLPLRNPIIPETVDLNNDGAVQLLGQALDGLHGDGLYQEDQQETPQAQLQNQQELERIPWLRPKKAVNYNTLHRSGKK